MSRRQDLDRFYALLDDLETTVGGPRRLRDCDGRMRWPDRGLYVFFHPMASRASSDQRRVTRIGTHAVSAGSDATLWSRLRTHRGAQRGSYAGGGNHRGSVFRKRVGEARIVRDGLAGEYPTWGVGSTAGQARRLAEMDLERWVSEYIRDLPFLWVAIDDEPGPESDRAYVEQHAIALVSNRDAGSRDTDPIDPRAEAWLGHHSPVDAIAQSGLWNVDHVDDSYDPAFLDVLEGYIKRMPGFA